MIIYVDIDDTICRRGKPNSDTNSDIHSHLDYKNSIPYKNRIYKINHLYDEGHIIVYWTARGSLTNINWFNTTYKQLTEWGCKFNELRMGKPVYDVLIDDKAFNTVEDFLDM